jgi:hypothetical protein
MLFRDVLVDLWSIFLFNFLLFSVKQGMWQLFYYAFLASLIILFFSSNQWAWRTFLWWYWRIVELTAHSLYVFSISLSLYLFVYIRGLIVNNLCLISESIVNNLIMFQMVSLCCDIFKLIKFNLIDTRGGRKCTTYRAIFRCRTQRII